MPEVTPPTRDQADYMRASDIANALLSDGVPVLRFNVVGGRVSLTFGLVDQRASYTALIPVEEANSARFRELYEAMR